MQLGHVWFPVTILTDTIRPCAPNLCIWSATSAGTTSPFTPLHFPYHEALAPITRAQFASLRPPKRDAQAACSLLLPVHSDKAADYESALQGVAPIWRAGHLVALNEQSTVIRLSREMSAGEARTGGRLVQEEDGGRGDERACNVQPPLLAARQAPHQDASRQRPAHLIHPRDTPTETLTLTPPAVSLNMCTHTGRTPHTGPVDNEKCAWAISDVNPAFIRMVCQIICSLHMCLAMVGLSRHARR